MPIEIRELVIRARVAPGGERRPAAEPPAAAEGAKQQEIVRACVQEVMRILEDKRER